MSTDMRDDPTIKALINEDNMETIREYMVEVLTYYPEYMTEEQEKAVVTADDADIIQSNVIALIEELDDRDIYKMRAVIRGEFYAED